MNFIHTHFALLAKSARLDYPSKALLLFVALPPIQGEWTMTLQIFWVSNELCEPYVPEKHLEMARQFFVWKDGLVLVGNFLTHDQLYHLARYHQILPRCALIGAGVLLNGIVDRWHSVGYNLTTPKSIQLALLQAFGACERGESG